MNLRFQVFNFKLLLYLRHSLFLYYQTKNKNRRFIFFFVDFKKSRFLIFWFALNLPLGHVMGGPTRKFGPDCFSRFDVYWKQNKRQALSAFVYI